MPNRTDKLAQKSKAESKEAKKIRQAIKDNTTPTVQEAAPAQEPPTPDSVQSNSIGDSDSKTMASSNATKKVGVKRLHR